MRLNSDMGAYRMIIYVIIGFALSLYYLEASEYSVSRS